MADQTQEQKDNAAKVVVPRKPSKFEFAGRANGVFAANGEGFGPKGTISLGGKDLSVDRWDDRTIRGQMPADAVYGPVVIKLADGQSVSGEWAEKKAVPVVVVEVKAAS